MQQDMGWRGGSWNGFVPQAVAATAAGDRVLTLRCSWRQLEWGCPAGGSR